MPYLVRVSRLRAVHLSMLAACALLLCSPGARAETLSQLGESFWQWRAQEQPFSNDDIPRIDRPAGFAIDWRPQTVKQRLLDLADFERRYRALSPGAETPIPAQVDYRLVGSAIARVRWELAVEQGWKRNPGFYVDQTLGSLNALLLQPPPFSDERQRALVRRAREIPATLQAAQDNLTDMRQPFIQLAVDSLDQVTARLQRMETGLATQFSAANQRTLHGALPASAAALEHYRAWLQTRLASARTDTAVGRDSYLFFLRRVALLPYTPEQLLSMGRQEWVRAVSFESYQQTRNGGLPPPRIFASSAAQMAAEEEDEEKVRVFLVQHGILSVPDWLKHYRNLPLPDYLVPLAGLAETDDLTGPARLAEDGTSYIQAPRADLGFFELSKAYDPRPILVHEGVPGHYFQLCLGWRNPDPLRRHYYDSGANEGIGFYAEEMMLQAGYFDDNPHTVETIYSFMRLRALRVEVDVKLALGEFSLAQAAAYLASTVPMDKETALAEASFFASAPGQAISYQIGKLQIMKLLADARRAQGKDFRLQQFHDFVWSNGNVPLALQRWELLSDSSDVGVTPPP
jgi:uncharacterized protein (DUF885 family)